MEKTLLELTQDILSVMDGDNVNSIFDTEESEQVARTIIRTYEALVSNSNWDHTRKGLTFVPLTDNDLPTHIKLEDNVKQLEQVNYNKTILGSDRTRYEQVKWKEPDDFLRYTNGRDSSSPVVQVVKDLSGIELLIENNKQPDYFTSFDDKHLIFDSFDSSVDSTIQESKIQAFGFVSITFKLQDDAVPQLPPDAWSFFISEATSKAQYWIRQFEDVKSESDSRKQSRWLSRKNWRVKGSNFNRDYGRK